MIKPCKHYNFRLPAYRHLFDHCCLVHNGVIECMFPCNWNNASKRCKYYEVEPEDQWALFVEYIDHEHIYSEPHKVHGTWTVQFETREITKYIQISQTFRFEQEAINAMPSWLTNVVVRKIES